MAKVRYTGKKKGYGPLKLRWMEKPVNFKGGLSESMSEADAKALCEAEPKIFKLVAEKKKPEPEVVEETRNLDEMTKDELMVFGEPLKGFACSMSDTKEVMIETIVACLPTEPEV